MHSIAARNQPIHIGLQQFLNNSGHLFGELRPQCCPVFLFGRSAHFRVVLDLWLGATRPKRQHYAIRKRERYHLAGLAAGQTGTAVRLRRIKSGGQIAYGTNGITAIAKGTRILDKN